MEKNVTKNHETIIAENAPTPEQLFHLASIGIVSASRRQRLKSMSTSPKAHFFVDEIHFLNSFKEEEPGEIHHRMAGRIGRKAINQIPIPAWSLKFYDTYWVQQDAGNWAAQRSLYRFEWKKDDVTLAEKSVRFIDNRISGREEHDLGYYIEHPASLSDIDFLHVQMQVEQVNADDCDLIIADAKEYYGQLSIGR